MSESTYTAYRRCRVQCECSKCGRVILPGDPNFDYNTRNRDAGKYCNDCNKPAGWNAKQQRVESPSEWQRGLDENSNVVVKATFNGKCAVCGKPTVQGITPITPCKFSEGWKHTYCVESETGTSTTSTQAITASTTIKSNPIPSTSPVLTPKNENQNQSKETEGSMNPITQLIWSEIKPLVESVESRGNAASEQLERIQELMTQLEEAQKMLNADVLKRPTKELQITRLDSSKITIDSPHPMLEQLVVLTSCREHVYLYGPAGSGKSTGAWQASQALGLDFYSVSLNRQSTPSLLVGFMDAHGKYVETDFFKAYKLGGVYLIDEMDNASGNLLTTLNSALANGHMTFPCGRVDRHADFVCVATGNTCGRGADRQYNERQQLDAATLDRFAFLEWNYDETAEMVWSLNENADAEKWVKHVQAIRANALRTGVRVAVTPRASLKGAKLLKTGVSFETLDNMLIRKGLDVDTWNKIKDGRS